MRERTHRIYEFGPFRLDAQKRLLLHDRRPVKLFPKEFDTLLVLVERSGEVLDKDELLRKVWGETVVEEGNLTTHISHLRKALGERKGEHKYIVTVPGEGYRFVADVRELPGGGEIIVRERTRVAVETTEEREGVAARLSAAARARDVSGRPRRVLLPAGLAAAVALAGFLWLRRAERTAPPPPPQPPPPVRSIAVLPFKPLAAARRDEVLELGMADTLINKLSGLREIVVRPTSAVRRYTSLEQDAVAAGRELKVETVLEGSVQRIGDRVRVTARLVRVEDGAPLWAGTFNEKFTDIFAVQDSISERVAVTLAVELVGRERELLAKSHTRNAEAYRAYLIGRYFWNQRTEEGLKKSIEHFHRAIEADPQYALAYAGLADSHGALLVWSSVSPDEDFAKAKAAALKALEIDNSLAEVHAVLGTIKMYYEWDWPGAEKSCRRAIEMNPNNAAAHQRYAEYLVATGRFDEAVAEFRAGQQLDPLSLIMHTQEGATLYFARRYDEAIEKLRKTLEMDQNFMLAHVFLGVVFEAKGMYEEAISEFQKAGVASGGSLEEEARVAAAMRAAYVNAGERGYWRWWIDRYTERAKGRPIHNYNRARYYARLGENDQAYAWLDKAYQHKEAQLVTLKVDPAIDGIRSDPRYTDLLRRIRLGP